MCTHKQSAFVYLEQALIRKQRNLRVPEENLESRHIWVKLSTQNIPSWKHME